MKEKKSNFQNWNNLSKYYIYIILFVLWIILFFVWVFIWEKWYNNFSQFKEKTYQFRDKSNYKFINPLIECDIFRNSDFIKYNSLQDKIKTISDKITSNWWIQHISVYFRDLDNWPWFWYNENEEFTPASLLKVPIMISYFKKAETDQNILNKKILFQEDTSSEMNNIIQNIKPKKELIKGKEYTIDQLIENMIIYSNNKAVNILLQNIDADYLNIIYSDLNIRVNENSISGDFMTVKDYAYFFRILYNASYLNREMSEKALNLLSQIDFKEGLVAWVPNDIIVSHKFWERINWSVIQLHDCWIIYYPNKPYLLCIITRGDNLETLKKIVADVSKAIFDEISLLVN